MDHATLRPGDSKAIYRDDADRQRMLETVDDNAIICLCDEIQQANTASEPYVSIS
ncbi:MAG: hypothetical protein ACYTG0_21575 [Planctomycetota bacterium]